MIEWIWKEIEPLVQAAIADRIVKYNKSLVDRGEIQPPDTEGPDSNDQPPGASLQPVGSKALV